MSEKRMLWLNANRPRGNENQIFRDYKLAKTNFRRVHREIVQKHIESTEAEIDTAAELDNNEFWRLINQKRKPLKFDATLEMNFDGTVYQNPQSINLGWQNYFSELYSPTVNPEFKDSYIQSCEEELHSIKQTLMSCQGTSIVIDESQIETTLKTCKKNKACGYDKVYNENIIYGGPILITALNKLFQAMIDISHIPTDLKRGIIITLFKGGNKCKSDPNSYRAISLCSTILKLFEKVLLQHIKTNSNFSVNPLQGGFQKNVSSIMTAFLLRESVFFAKEHESMLYTCFLDVRQCFDRVSHSILMLKLYNTGIDKSIFKVILNMFKNVYSCVKSQGLTSDWFPVLQGTRQGQVLSPVLYLIFINDLMNRLEASKYCFKIQNLSYGCPTHADDMVLVSLTKHGLENLIDICYNNSLTERYLYNAQKSNICIFNKNRRDFEKHTDNSKLGHDIIQETDNYVHLGVPCNIYMTLKSSIDLACSKLRKTYFSLADCGVHKNGLHPLTSKHLYESIVLPRALYGCELWSELNDSELLSLERVHRQCIKYMQSMHQCTRTDIALSCIGILPIEFEIDKRKLLLFGQLCHLDTDKRIKTIFVSRLFHFLMEPRKARGFIPDIYRIFGKYKLMHIFNDFYKNGTFPSLHGWKRMIKAQINIIANCDYQNRLLSDQNLQQFYQIHNEIKPFSMWHFSRLYRDNLQYCRTVMLLVGRFFSRKFNTACPKCKLVTDCVVEHLILFCITNDSLRHILWRNIHEILGICNFENFCSLTLQDQIIEMLTGFVLFEIDDNKRIRIIKMTCRFIHYMCKSLMIFVPNK
jgi:hypothetical protein